MNETFNDVMLSVIGTRNMYEAWENMSYAIIEGYNTPENETAQAHKDEWITKFPRVLSMQLNRLRF